MDEPAEQMIKYIEHDVIRRADVHITDSTRLLSSGLIDSLATVDILMKLEDVTDMRIPAGKVQPKDLDTVQLMLATAARVGKPRK